MQSKYLIHTKEENHKIGEIEEQVTGFQKEEEVERESKSGYAKEQETAKTRD